MCNNKLPRPSPMGTRCSRWGVVMELVLCRFATHRRGGSVSQYLPGSGLAASRSIDGRHSCRRSVVPVRPASARSAPFSCPESGLLYCQAAPNFWGRGEAFVVAGQASGHGGGWGDTFRSECERYFPPPPAGWGWRIRKTKNLDMPSMAPAAFCGGRGGGGEGEPGCCALLLLVFFIVLPIVAHRTPPSGIVVGLKWGS